LNIRPLQNGGDALANNGMIVCNQQLNFHVASRGS
jgi:hypothetical protein